MADEEKTRGRGLVRLAWDATTYGVRRPYRELVSSARGLGSELARFRAARRQREALAQEAREDYVRRTQGLTPAQRFASEVERGGWSAQDLQEQERAARIARRACLVICSTGFLAFLIFMYFAPAVLMLIFAVLAMALLAGCIAQAVRSAWWEFQLQSQVLIPLRAFLSRADLFKRLRS